MELWGWAVSIHVLTVLLVAAVIYLLKTTLEETKASLIYAIVAVAGLVLFLTHQAGPGWGYILNYALLMTWASPALTRGLLVLGEEKDRSSSLFKEWLVAWLATLAFGWFLCPLGLIVLVGNWCLLALWWLIGHACRSQHVREERV